MERLENPTGNRGSDVLLMGKLTAENPQKWNRNIQVTHDVPPAIMEAIRTFKAEAKAIREAREQGTEEPKVIEGEARVEKWPWE